MLTSSINRKKLGEAVAGIEHLPRISFKSLAQETVYQKGPEELLQNH
jgi:hypothetical protein